MIYEIEQHKIYRSKSGYRCKVLHIGQHGQDCSISMIVYTNLEETFDSPIGKIWVMEESLFMTRFSEDWS